jgi:hypothetical protein
MNNGHRVKSFGAPFRFCFTLDTEPDNLWDYSPGCTFESFKRLPAFHRKLTAAGARPTYLTTSEVVESHLGRSAIETCLGTGTCEIGAHFHTWTRQWPFEVTHLGNPPIKAMGHRLDARVEAGMLAYTCEAIFKSLGREPKSFRGGRWSFGPNTVRALHQCGIEVDSTFTPGISWSDQSKSLTDGADFRTAPMSPHYLSKSDYHTGPLIELPIGSAAFPRPVKAACRFPIIHKLLAAVQQRKKLNQFSQGLFHWLRESAGVRIGYHWLRPTDTSVADMRAVMLSLKQRRCAVWVFMVHSSEIIPCRPLPTGKDVSQFLDRCLEGIHVAMELGAQPATLTEAARWVRRHHLLKPVGSEYPQPGYPFLHQLPGSAAGLGVSFQKEVQGS